MDVATGSYIAEDPCLYPLILDLADGASDLVAVTLCPLLTIEVYD